MTAPRHRRLARLRIAALPIVAAMMRSTRRVISAAARRVKVSSRIRPGWTQCRTRLATRWASVLVLPEPAPAMISSGPHNEASDPFAKPCSAA